MTTRRSISSTICCPRSCWKMCVIRVAIPLLREIRPCELSDAPFHCTWEVRLRNYHSAPMAILATVLSRTKTPISAKGSSKLCHRTQRSSLTALVILRWPSLLGLKACMVNLRNLRGASTSNISSPHNMIEVSWMLINKCHRWEASNNKIQSLNKSSVQSLMSLSLIHVKTVWLWSETIPRLATRWTKGTTATRKVKLRRAKTLSPLKVNFTQDS